MFLTAPIVWLQSWASPELTRTLEVVSWFGYTRTTMALAVFIAFAFSLRPALAVLILLGLNSIAIDMTKTAAALPRPFAVDRDVRLLGWPAPSLLHWSGEAARGVWDHPRVIPPAAFEQERDDGRSADSETGFGFPSGHVSTTATFVAGLAGLVGWRWVRVAGPVWLSLMALSRLYLGRHFIADVIGGLAVASVIVIAGVTLLRLSVVASAKAGDDGRAAWLNAVVAAALVAVAVACGRPDVGDAGRLLGMTVAVLLLVRLGVGDLPSRWITRARLVLSAAVSYGVMWAALSLGLQAVDAAASPAGRLAKSAVPAAAMLLVPGLSIRRHEARARRAA